MSERDTDPELRTPVPERAPPRPTDGDTLVRLEFKRKYVVALIGLLAGPGGLATWKAFSAADTAETAQERAAVVAEATGDQLGAAYEAIRKKQLEQDAALTALGVRVNNLLDRQRIIESLAVRNAPAKERVRFRKEARPALPPVTLEPKAPLPPTPAAAAAAAPGEKP